MSEQSGLVIKNSDDLRDLLVADAAKIFAALPSHITQERMIGLACRALILEPKLKKCTPVSLLDSVAQASNLGIELDGVLGRGFLIPYGDECQLVLGYKGMLDLARRHADVKDITAKVVYSGDDFEYEFGDSPFIRHKPSEDEDRHIQDITHIYVNCNLTNGGKQMDVWTTARVNDHRDRYANAKALRKETSPWKTAWDKMGKKTVLRSMISSGEIPSSAEVQTMATYEEYANAGVGKVVDTKPPADLSGLLDDIPAPNTDQAPGVKEPISPEVQAAIDENRGFGGEWGAVAMTLSLCGNVDECEKVLKDNEGFAHSPEAYDELCNMVEARKTVLRDEYNRQQHEKEELDKGFSLEGGK